MRIAQTNVQLYNELRDAGLPLDDLVLVHRAYELLTTLYPGYYQADGKPFVAHGVGVASILARLDQPAEILAVGLLHNIYGNADFGDGRSGGTTRFRRRLVRQAVGEQVEGLLVRFMDLRIHPHRIEDARRALPGRDDTERRLLLVDLADHLEKYVDLGVLHFGESDWVMGSSERIGRDLIEIAEELGEPRLGAMLSRAFAEAAAQAAEVPAELRPSDGRRYLELVVPRSCRRRLPLRLRANVQEVRRRLRSRGRLRRLRSASRRLPRGA
jgi:hypothetical protein